MSDAVLLQKAMDKGLITEAHVAEATQRQVELEDRGLDRSTWLILQDLGHLDPEAARDLERRSSSDSLAALVVDGFQILGRVGRGGMGDVFLGQHSDGREAAVKMLPTRLARDSEYLGRFQREIEALSRLRHPGITGFIGRGSIGGRPYLIMELVRGPSLKEYLQGHGALSEYESRELLQQVGVAMAAAWEMAGLVHRDLKPANILLAENGDPTIPFIAKVCDFGLAKFQGRTDYTVSVSHGGLTHSGVAIGTPHYMSPEQATGDRSVDQRHDIYGLGATIYHGLLGKTLYSGGSSAVIMYKQATATLDLEPLRRLGIAPGFVDLLGRMLAKPVENRIADWQQVLGALGELAPLASGAKPARKVLQFAGATAPDAASGKPGAAGKAGSGERRGGLLPLVLITTALVCIGAGVLLAGMGGETPPAVSSTGPEGLQAALAGLAERSGGVRELHLRAGTYRGPWLLTGAHDGLRLVAADGVQVEVEEGPALEVAAGVRDVHIVNVHFSAREGTILVSAASALQLQHCRLSGGAAAVRLAAGRLVLEDCSLLTQTGITVEAGSELSLRRCALAAAGPLLVGRDASIGMREVRLTRTGPGGSDLMSITGGAVTLDRVQIEASPASTALRLRDLGFGQLRDLVLRGAAVGLVLDNAVIDEVQGLSIAAADVGLVVQGRPPPTATWSAVAITAPRAVDGLQDQVLDSAGSGADATRLQSLPPAP